MDTRPDGYSLLLVAQSAELAVPANDSPAAIPKPVVAPVLGKDVAFEPMPPVGPPVAARSEETNPRPAPQPIDEFLTPAPPPTPKRSDTQAKKPQPAAKPSSKTDAPEPISQGYRSSTIR